MQNFRPAESLGFVVGGMTGVGKTTLLREMTKSISSGSQKDPTCVCDVVVLKSSCGKIAQKRDCFVSFYDMAGLPKYLTGRTSVYCHVTQNIFGTIFVFDVTDQKSFDVLDQWYKELNVTFPMTDPDFVKILVGNKLDKQSLCVPMQAVEMWAEKFGFRICLTAALDGRGVPEILPFLMEISGEILARRETEPNSVKKSFSATSEQIQSVYRIINGEDDWERLGLPPGSNGAMVAKAYRRLATQIHPDKCPINGSGEAFKLLTASKDALVVSKDKIFVKNTT